MHGFAGRVDDLATFVVNTGMNLVAAVAVLGAVVVVRTTVIVVRTTDLVLGSSSLAGSSTSSGDGLATTPCALASIKGFTHLVSYRTRTSEW